MRIIMGDLLTGRRILDVPYEKASWEIELNGPGKVTCSVDMRDPEIQALDMRNSATVGKAFLGAVEDDVIVEAGPIWTRSFDRATGRLNLIANGLWSYFDHRTVLPVIGDLPVVDPATGESAAWANTTLTGLHLGTIGKRLLQQSMLWPGGALPLVFEADKAGDNERTYLGAELPVIGDMLTNLTNVENGPDVEFRPQWTPDRLGVRWLYRSGDPRIFSPTDHLLDASVPGSPVEELNVTESGSRLVSLGWCSGGRSADQALVDRVLDPSLLDAGYPLMERVDSSRSSVSEPATIRAHAANLVRTGSRPVAQWALSVHTGGEGEPRITDYACGDFLQIKVGGDLFIPDGRYRRRIVNLSHTAGEDKLTIGLGEDYG